jgi:ADP-ribose pyrophosphatase YjhB (NUDIX family)
VPTESLRIPRIAVDLIIETGGGQIVLIRRRNPPPGWALPGGFLEYGESLEQAAVREAKEETALDVELVQQFHTYSDPRRDPRGHTVSTVFIARAHGAPKAGDDAGDVQLCSLSDLPSPLAFDHDRILADYLAVQRDSGNP